MGRTQNTRDKMLIARLERDNVLPWYCVECDGEFNSKQELKEHDCSTD